MSKPRTVLTVSYRVLDENGKTLEVFKKTGFNRRYLQWSAERYAKHKYGKKMKIHPYKVVEETD
jgi:hypothetical protein